MKTPLAAGLSPRRKLSEIESNVPAIDGLPPKFDISQGYFLKESKILSCPGDCQPESGRLPLASSTHSLLGDLTKTGITYFNKKRHHRALNCPAHFLNLVSNSLALASQFSTVYRLPS